MKKVLRTQGILMVTVFVFIMLDCRWVLPYNTILRWVMPAILLFISLPKVTISPTMGVVFACFGITILSSIDKTYTFERWVSLVLINVSFLSYFALCKRKNTLNQALIAIGALFVVYGFLNGVFLQWSEPRPTGITNSANSLGVVSNVTFIFCQYFRRNSSKHSFVWTLLMVLAAACCFLSAARICTVCFLLNIIFYYVIDYHKKMTKERVIVRGVLIIALCLILPRILSYIPGIARITESGGIGKDRTRLWDYGWLLITQRPYIGWGYGVSASMNLVRGLAFHNSYITILVETGVIGLLAVLLHIAANVLPALKHDNATKDEGVKTAVIMVLNLTLIAFGESFMTSVGSTEGCLYWMLLAWLYVACHGNNRGNCAV